MANAQDESSYADLLDGPCPVCKAPKLRNHPKDDCINAHLGSEPATDEKK